MDVKSVSKEVSLDTHQPTKKINTLQKPKESLINIGKLKILTIKRTNLNISMKLEIKWKFKESIKPFKAKEWLFKELQHLMQS